MAQSPVIVTAEDERADARRARMRAVLERIQATHEKILKRRGGEPIDGDAALDERRGGMTTVLLVAS